MGVAVGVTGLDDRQLVGMFPDVGEIVGDQQATCAAWFEGSEVGGQETDLSAAGVDVFFIRGQGFAGMPFQFRLVVEGVDLTGRSIH